MLFYLLKDINFNFVVSAAMAPRDVSKVQLWEKYELLSDIYGDTDEDDEDQTSESEFETESENVPKCWFCHAESGQLVFKVCSCTESWFGHKLCIEAYIQDAGIDKFSTCVSCKKPLPLEIKFKPMREVSLH